MLDFGPNNFSKGQINFRDYQCVRSLFRVQAVNRFQLKTPLFGFDQHQATGGTELNRHGRPLEVKQIS